MEITLQQWNVWYDEDIDNVIEQLHSDAADIICLQELTIDNPKQRVANTPEFVAEALGYYLHYQPVPIEATDGSKLTLANAILSRFPVASKHFAWINEPKQGGGYNDEYRAYVEATLDIDGTLLTVGTTHMSYTHKFEPTDSKQAETEALMCQIIQHDHGFIFCGDLNAVPDSDTLARVESHLTHVGPSLDQPTWTTKPFSYNGFAADTLQYRLDYIFATADVRAVSSRIVRTDYSDHLPIVATFEI